MSPVVRVFSNLVGCCSLLITSDFSSVGPDEVEKQVELWNLQSEVQKKLMKWWNGAVMIPLQFLCPSHFAYQTDKSESRNEVGRIDYAGLIKDNELFWKKRGQKKTQHKGGWDSVAKRREEMGKRDGKVLIMQPRFCCPIKYKIFSLCTLCLVAQMTADQSWCISEHVCVCTCAGRVEQQSPSRAVTPSQWSQNPKTDKSSCDVTSAI